MPRRPNLVFVTSHDIGRRLGCYGHAGVRTPRLDALAGEGLRFERAFCTQAQCSPARASLATGREPHRNGVMGLSHGAFAWELFAGVPTLPAILREEGYRTATTGVYHVGKGDPAFVREEPRADGWGPATADAACRVIADWAEDDAPFYLQVGFTEGHRAPGHEHHEWGPMPALDVGEVELPGYLRDDPGVREEFAQLHGSIAWLDVGVGRILDELDRHGLRDNTLVVFAADHGIPFVRDKTSCYDAGLEIALLMSGPGVSSGRTTRQLVSGVDVLPTICELLGVDAPSDIDGRSATSLCRGDDEPIRDAIFAQQTYHNYCDPMRAIRTERHKLIVSWMPCAAVYNATQQWRPLAAPVVPADPKSHPHRLLELYDLELDPWELDDRADDPAYAEVRADLLARLAAHMQATDDPLLRGELPVPPRFREATALLSAAAAS